MKSKSKRPPRFIEYQLEEEIVFGTVTVCSVKLKRPTVFELTKFEEMVGSDADMSGVVEALSYVLIDLPDEVDAKAVLNRCYFEDVQGMVENFTDAFMPKAELEPTATNSATAAITSNLTEQSGDGLSTMTVNPLKR